MNRIEAIQSPGVPASQLPFSPAIRAGNFVFVSGQASVDVSGQIVSDSFEGEVRRSFDNVAKVLAGAGLSLRDVVQVRSYVRFPDDLAEYNQIYRDFFQDPFPARTTLTGCLPETLKFEVDVTAWCGAASGEEVA